LIAYKLLREGRVAPFSGVVWPEPGEWIEVAGIDPCRQGIHACRIEDLPLWLGLGELWMVELDDVAVEARKLVARRGRLLRRVEGWDGAAAEKFVAGCEARARSRAENAPELAQFADDIAGGATPAVAGYIAARAAELHRGPPEYDLERKCQADWLADRLGLSGRLVDDRRRRRFRWLGI
jgi:hypothetical protein